VRAAGAEGRALSCTLDSTFSSRSISALRLGVACDEAAGDGVEEQLGTPLPGAVGVCSALPVSAHSRLASLSCEPCEPTALGRTCHVPSARGGERQSPQSHIRSSGVDRHEVAFAVLAGALQRP
jgi:hypothetical protein